MSELLNDKWAMGILGIIALGWIGWVTTNLLTLNVYNVTIPAPVEASLKELRERNRAEYESLNDRATRNAGIADRNTQNIDFIKQELAEMKNK